MTDKQFRKQKKRVMKLIGPWIERMGLRWWKVDCVWHRGRLPARLHPDNEGQVAAVCIALWAYGTANIHWNLELVSAMSDDELEFYVVHELCHVLIAEMNEDGHEHEEHVATTLAKAFRWTRQMTLEEKHV